ncbi:SusC/RagA family TonB-linked outer membrane protein [Chitinophaga varians]|uniref:SusC/RagA family TonB-linked outer membrane protein n=1 Tax=Chitinophaga varians TaxID=2202339 RepID=A0A847S6X9_9BACT|nr:SusC/RagA family TonB-linked outer membrane protein [Chitinophaga varians]NLR69135.1 SusC/RagA family TonB-linked outer membrane protein [Chitinophaga varians]
MRSIHTLMLVVGAFLLLPCSHLHAQPRMLKGHVTAAGTNTALPGVTVQIKGAARGTTTGPDGSFRIEAPAGPGILVFSFIGYLAQEVPIGSQSTIDVTLQPDTRSLDQVVVTAMGIKKEKRAIGYAIQDVSGADLAQSKQSNVVNALQGKVAGVQISSGGGAPGQGSRILIRGINSLDPTRDNQPLFVIDGITMDNNTYTDIGNAGGADTRGMSNRASDINPDDIESISVLKGGAATALYGLRAASGAVIITTKSGKAGRTRVSFTTTAGFDKVGKTPDVQLQYSQGNNGLYDNQSFWPAWGPTVEEARKLDPSHPASLYNNYKQAYNTGSQYRNTLAISGGTEKVVYTASLSQFNQNGVIPFSNYQNYSARVGGDIRFSEKVKMGVSLNYINSGGNRANADRYGEQMIYWSPRWNMRDYLKPDGTQQTYGATDNPIYTLYTNRYGDNVNRLIGNINFTYSPFKWLDILYRAGTDFYTDNRRHTGPGPKGITGEVVNTDNGFGFVDEYMTNQRSLSSTLILNFKNQITPKLTSDLKLGHDLFDRHLKRLATEGDTLDIPDLLIMQNAKKIVSNQYLENYYLIGVFGDWTLSWDRWLYLTLSGRTDISSSLPAGHRAFFYPSVSMSYLFTEHLKIPENVLSYGKVRASWARVGKDALPYNTGSGYIPLTDGPIDNNVIGWTRANRYGDAQLKPEFTNTFEAGAELRFLHDRIGVDFAWYTSKSTDLLIPVKLSSATGYEDFYTNAGSIRNTGVEIAFNATPIKKTKFQWDVRVNFSANHNEVLSLGKGLSEVVVGNQFGYAGSTATMKYIPGYPVGAIFGTSYQRYMGGQPDNSILIDYSRPIQIAASGSLAGFPMINSSQKYLGNSQPKWIGAITNTFSYGPLSLSVLIDTRQGAKKYNQLANFMSAFGESAITADRFTSKVFNGVLPDGTPNSQVVYLQQAKGPDGRNYGGGFYRNIYRGVTENFVENASWIRLRNVSLSWQLPQKFLSRTHLISAASLTFTGNNLWLHTKYTGFDPESSSLNAGSNIDAFAGFTYPTTRSYMASLNVTF